MHSFAAREAVRRFSDLIAASRRGPASIRKHGRVCAVVISPERYVEYEALRLEKLDEERRKRMEAAHEAAKDGGADESAQRRDDARDFASWAKNPLEKAP